MKKFFLFILFFLSCSELIFSAASAPVFVEDKVSSKTEEFLSMPEITDRWNTIKEKLENENKSKEKELSYIKYIDYFLNEFVKKHQESKTNEGQLVKEKFSIAIMYATDSDKTKQLEKKYPYFKKEEFNQEDYNIFAEKVRIENTLNELENLLYYINFKKKS